jgi:Zn-dependent protease
MLTDFFNNPIAALLYFAALILAIAIHEFSHALIADRLGDPTPSLQGRLTLNPLAHLDPIGTILLLIVGFGWGKPVQFDPFNLRNPRRDAAFISLAGPISNLLVAAVAAILFRILYLQPFSFGILEALLLTFLKLLVQVNVMLAIFNLIPIHPLDGFKIVGGIIPEEQAKQWYELEQYGFIFLIFLLLPIFGNSPIHSIMAPPINLLLRILLPQAPMI